MPTVNHDHAAGQDVMPVNSASSVAPGTGLRVMMVVGFPARDGGSKFPHDMGSGQRRLQTAQVAAVA